MLPVALIAVGCVILVLVASFALYRLRAAVYVSGDSEDDDDDDDDELVSPSGARPAAETAALMDSEDESSLELKRARRRSGQADDLSLFAHLVALVRPVDQTKLKNKKKAPLMHRRTKGVKKIHKPYFYPLLDETAQWYADWETRRQQAAEKPASGEVDARIDKPGLHDAGSRDLLDSSLDCASLVSFRAGSHTVIPIAAI